MDFVTRFWLIIRRSGWFEPSATGGIFPFPFAWQAWAIMAVFIAAIAASVVLHGEAAWLTRIILCSATSRLGSRRTSDGDGR